MQASYLRRGVAAAVSVLGLGFMAVPAQAGPVTLLDGINDVVTYDDAGDPINVPRADIIGATADYRPGEFAFTMKVNERVDPRTDPNWADASSVAGWVVSTNGDNLPEYAVSFVVANGGLAAGVAHLEKPEEILCMAKSAEYTQADGYAAVLDTSCLGSPASIKWGAMVVYDTNPNDENAPVVIDVAPDGDTLAGPITNPAPPPGLNPSDGGYWLVGTDGGIFSFNAPFSGSTGNLRLNQPIVNMTADPDGKGYWFVASDGGIFAYDAPFFGSTGDIKLNKPIVGMTATPTGQGYWMVASDGGIFSFGDAKFWGSTGNLKLNKPIVGMASTPSGQGYWLVASDGGIFSFGDAKFWGSTGNIKLNQPIVGMAATKTGNGYWFVAADGGIFSYGDAKFFGSAVGPLSPVVGMAAARDGQGYSVVRADGVVVNLGSAPKAGQVSTPLNRPIVGMAATV